MLIRVRYYDDSFGLVDDSRLEIMIADGRIAEFLRASGWVRIGQDAVRMRFSDRRSRGRLINTYV